MKKFLSHIYQSILPFQLRSKIYDIRYTYDLKKFKSKIIRYYSSLSPEKRTSEHMEVVAFLKRNPLNVFPYSFPSDYKASNIEVFKDTQSGLFYVFFDGKRLFFKRSWTEDIIKRKFCDLLIEQDENSPHRYLTHDFQVDHDTTVADIGVAEGNFSLGIVEKVKKLYLFETNPEWIEALEKTFAPWKDKTEIINKFVSNRNNQNHISLDSFFKGKGEIDFLKIDVDGSEAELLNGCAGILNNQNQLKIALCTYHKQEDEQIFSAFLRNKNFDISLSKGFMIFINDGLNLTPPYLRRGLIRATKKEY